MDPGRRDRLGCAGGAVALALSLLGGTSVAAADEALHVGQVIERVACRAEAKQTYALYLPSTYRPDRAWPILYAFDPAARGAVPVRLFSQAAERLGVVVAASNNSRNGPLPPVQAALQAVWFDTHERLALDPARVYATGMSGGNLPALILAANQGAGMIACAGAFTPSQIPKTERRLDWLGIAGDADFNFDLTKSVVATMVERGAVARFATFEGGHSWPPESLAARALEWLELGAMRAGVRPQDAALIDSLYQQGLERARELLAQGRADDAAEENAALAREFAGLRPVEGLAAEARRLRDTPEAKKGRRREVKLAERQRSYVTELVTLRGEIEHAVDGNEPALQSSPETATNEPGGRDLWKLRHDLAGRLAGLTQELEAKEADVRSVARRVLDWFYIDTYYNAGERRDQKRFDLALVDFEICSQTRPKNPSPVYEKARTYAARGDRRRALAELKRSIALGFADASRLAGEPEWAALRGDPEFLAAKNTLVPSP